MTILRIKNMVCPRCIKVVKEELEKLGLEVVSIQLGKVVVKSDHDFIEEDTIKIKNSLEKEGFELIEDKQEIIVEKVKTAIIKLIYSGEIENFRTNFSDYIAQAVGKDYHQISIIFSLATHMTVERYFILQKVERAKELLSYGDMRLNEIARKLGYSSIAHLSNQFKHVVGQSPTQYKKEIDPNRNFIDHLE
jgi:AraC family transcriptional regulator